MAAITMIDGRVYEMNQDERGTLIARCYAVLDQPKQIAITLTTDGSGTTLGNPGGWACVLRCGEHMREVVGGADSTTSNLMELTAVAEGLACVRWQGVAITVRSDSQCVIGWLTGRMHARQPAIAALVHRIQAQIAANQWRVTYEWVRGHTGDPDNERCDTLAGAERRRRLALTAH